MEEPVDLKKLLGRARTELAEVGASALDAELLAARALGRGRSWLLAHGDYRPDADERARIHGLVARRRAGEPLAYIIGEREFWSLSLEVNPAVLIPRPETELLVERALELISEGDKARVLELGTGSGAVAIAIASERPRCRITATDKSAAALEVARRNAERLVAGRIRLLRSDWFERLAGERFDLIVSNPPYVAADDPRLSETDIAREPREALVAGSDGLDEIRRIAAGLREHLQAGARVLLEHGAMQASGVAGILAARGLEVVACRRDLAGLDRVTEARAPDTEDD